MKNVLLFLTFSMTFSSFAGGLPGVKSKKYIGENNNEGRCLVEITRSKVTYYNVMNSGSHREYSRRSFEYNEDRDSYIFIDYEIGKFETEIILDKYGDFLSITFNKGKTQGYYKEESCVMVN